MVAGQVEQRQHRLAGVPQPHQERALAERAELVHRQQGPPVGRCHHAGAGVLAGLLSRAAPASTPRPAPAACRPGESRPWSVSDSDASTSSLIASHACPSSRGARVGPPQRRRREHIPHRQRPVQRLQHAHRVGVAIYRALRERGVGEYRPLPRRLRTSVRSWLIWR